MPRHAHTNLYTYISNKKKKKSKKRNARNNSKTPALVQKVLAGDEPKPKFRTERTKKCKSTRADPYHVK